MGLGAGVATEDLSGTMSFVLRTMIQETLCPSFMIYYTDDHIQIKLWLKQKLGEWFFD